MQKKIREKHRKYAKCFEFVENEKYYTGVGGWVGGWRGGRGIIFIKVALSKIVRLALIDLFSKQLI